MQHTDLTDSEAFGITKERANEIFAHIMSIILFGDNMCPKCGSHPDSSKVIDILINETANKGNCYTGNEKRFIFYMYAKMEEDNQLWVQTIVFCRRQLHNQEELKAKILEIANTPRSFL